MNWLCGIVGVYVLMIDTPPTARIPESAIRTARTTGNVVLILLSPDSLVEDFSIKVGEEVC